MIPSSRFTEISESDTKTGFPDSTKIFNSSPSGSNPEKWIKNVHIKDCIPEIYSVPLGKGNVNFDLIIKKLSDIKYSGDFILQTAYKTNENCKDIIKNYYKFTEKYVRKYFNGIKS